MAGLTVWALMVPQALAYAGIAGVPVQNGLYVMPLAVVGYVLLGSSRHLYVGPSATVATLSASTVAIVATASTGSADYVALTCALTLMVGVIYIAGGLARVGFISRFFARPVLEGFIVGLGLYIAIGQLPKVVGLAKPSGDTFLVLAKTLADVGKWEWTTVAVGVAALIALFAFARFAPKLPGVIIVVALAILAAKALDLRDYGVALVGDVPTGFHFVALSSVSGNDLVKMIPGAFAIVVVGLAQALAIAKSYATKYHYPVDANREMLGYGAANLGAGALQGYTVTGGLSASGAAERSGAKSPAAFLVSALMALLTILFLAGLFADLPEPVLGAIVVWAVSGMIKPGRVTQYRHAQSLEFWASLGALLGVILIDILPGVAIGVGLRFILLIHTIDHPHIAVLGRSRDGARFADLEDDEADATPVPGVLIYRFEAALIFANADLFLDDLLTRVHAADPRPDTVVLDFEAVGHVDVTGGEALRSVYDTLSAIGTRLIIARAKSSVRGALRRQGIADVVGEDNFAPTVA